MMTMSYASLGSTYGWPFLIAYRRHLRIALHQPVRLRPTTLVRVEFWLYNSFSHTHRGRNRRALVAVCSAYLSR